MRRGFTLLEVLLAAIILGTGLAAILVSMSQSQKMMLASSYLETAQEVMDLGDMAYPLSNVQDPDQDLDVRETKASELWDIVAGAHGPKMTNEQEGKFRGYT
jgi:prepilin-type N-terminal cleavage/methylation domain-containing protein